MKIAVRWTAVAVIAVLCIAGCGKKAVSTPARAVAVEAPLIDKWSFQRWDAPLDEFSEVTVNVGTLKGKPWAYAELSDDAGHTTKTVSFNVDEIASGEWARPVISPNGSYVAFWPSDDGDSEVGVFSTHTGKLIRRLPPQKDKHDTVSFSPFNPHLVYADFTIYNIRTGLATVLDSCHDYQSHRDQELERVDLVVLWLDPSRILVGGSVESFECLDPLHRPILAVYDLAREGKKQDLAGKLGRDESVISASLEPGKLIVATSDGTLDDYGELEETACYYFPTELMVENNPIRAVAERRD